MKMNNNIFNGKKLKAKRKNLRKYQTKKEKLIWSKLRNCQLSGLSFLDFGFLLPNQKDGYRIRRRPT